MATELLILPDAQTHRLVPATAHDQELIAGLRAEHYKAKLTQAKPRSVKQNRYYWGGVLTTIVENHEFYTRPEPLHLWLKTRMGYVNKITFHDGSVQMSVDSTAFDKMPPEEFRTFLDNAILILCTEVIPGLEPAMLKANAASKSGVSYREAVGGIEEGAPT